jgi:hypothetical protein
MDIRITSSAPEPPAPGKPIRVDRFYDRHIRLWTLLLKDEHGNQIGDAVYAGSKREALDEERRLYEEMKS